MVKRLAGETWAGHGESEMGNGYLESEMGNGWVMWKVVN